MKEKLPVIKYPSKNYFKPIGLLVSLLLFCNILAAQTVEISGQVKDEVGAGLPGVSILVEGSTVGTVTDIDGAYKLEVSSSDPILNFSYIGYISQNIPIAGQSIIDVVLIESIEKLAELVVVGYGTQKKVNLSGAVGTVDMKPLESRPTASISQGLQGTVAGLNVTFASGAPGGNANINIRGYTSVNGGKPLIIIDGIPSSEADLTRLNPDDVKSVSVLKDASSAAIYGARAAFGVLLVTTKTGGENKITYSNSFIWGRPTVTPDPITDPYIFSRLLDISTNNTPWDYVNYTDETYAWAKARSDDPTVPNVRLDPHNPSKWQYMGDNNWNDYFFNDNSFSQNHNVAISGQKDIVSYYVSGNYTKENGLNRLSDDYWKRNALRSRLQVTPYKWFKFENNTFFSSVVRTQPTFGITDVYNLRPSDVVKNPDGTWANTDAGIAAARLMDGGNTNYNTLGFNTTNKFDLLFFKEALKITAEHTFKNEQTKTHWDATKYKIGYGPNDIRELGGTGYAYESMGINKYNVLNLYATFAKEIGMHNFTVIGGYSQEENKYESFWANREDLISSSLPNMNLATGDQTVGWNYSDWSVRGVFGRINYILNDRYIVEFNGRYDGSSRFPEDNRFGFFPSVSGAWIASNENFMQPISNVFNQLKIRASHGSLGNQSVSNYGYIATMPTGQSGYLIDGEYPKTVYASGLDVDPNNYTWEKVVTTNIGLDMGFFQSRLNATFDYFIRNTIGMLTPSQELPGVLGTSVPRTNSADLQTKGWEFTLGYDNEVQLGGHPFQHSFSIILADNQTTITKYENEGELFSQWREGAQVGEIWGLESDDLFQSQEEIDRLDQTDIIPWGALAIVPGWPKFKDLNGDEKIIRGQSALEPEDFKLIGNSRQRYQVGFNMSLNWKGFDFNAFLQGVGMQDYYPQHYLFWGPYQQPYANMYPHLLDFYRGSDDSDALRAQHSQSYIDAGLADANTDAEYPILQSWLADVNYGTGLSIPNTKYMQSAAYLRIKNITVGYSLPRTVLEKIKLSKLRFYVTGENIYEWSSIKKHIDPEAIGERGYAYPFVRKLSFGMSLTF